jgi:exonuclease SbcD
VEDTLKLLHLADLHLGVQSGGRLDPKSGLNQRFIDVCDRFDEVCALAEAEGVHAVLFAGDAFNNQHPNPTLQSLFASRVRRLARGGASVFLLIGNHDLPKMASLHHPFSIYDALEVEGVVVGDRAKVYRLPLRDAPVPELQVAALPHFSRHQALALIGEDVDDPDAEIERLVEQTVRRLGDDVDPSLPSVFVGHCHVQQAEIGDGHSLFGVSDVEVSLSTLTSGQPFAYYALGHVHKHQVLSRDPFVAYPGSVERIDHGEGSRVDVAPDGKVSVRLGETKGFLRADLIHGETWQLAGEPSFREVHARPFVTIRLGDIDNHDPIADVARRIAAVRDAGLDLSDALVRVTGTIPSADRGRVTTARVRELIAEAYDVRLGLDAAGTALVRDPRFAERMTEIEALERFIETKDEWADDKAELLRLARELIAETL